MEPTQLSLPSLILTLSERVCVYVSMLGEYVKVILWKTCDPSYFPA